MYYKGGNMLHTLRQLVGDDARWRAVLRGLNQDFRHGIVTGAEVEAYIADHTGLELDRFFDQYLRSTLIPTLEWRLQEDRLSFRWRQVVPGFDMPVPVRLTGGSGGAGADAVTVMTLPATEAWQTVPVPAGTTRVEVDPDYFVLARGLDGPGGPG
ncbi:MAG: hypothetical protein P8188_09775 [Gemmatimonadota bacterium]